MKYIGYLIPLATLLLLTNCSTLHIPRDSNVSLQVAADSLIDDYIRNKELVGVSAGVMVNNKIVWQNGFGFLDVENEIEADTNMLHRLASITKSMTAVAVMQLVEQGRLKLDVPIQTYLPDYPKYKEGNITLRHLLNHTSGIKDYKYLRGENRPKKHYKNLAEAIQVFQNRKLKHPPGANYTYASYNYTVIGAIIERVTGQSYQDYMTENIWSKSGMVHTAIEEHGKVYPYKAQLYKKIKKGFKVDPKTDLSIKYPAGGVQSTVGDMLRFGKAVINNELISESSKMESFKGSGLTGRSFDYALGWLVQTDEKHGFIHYNNGHQSGTSTQFIIVPSSGFVVCVLTNSSKSGGVAQGLGWKLMRLYLE